eukprot:NP_497562.1 Uncharacterized protein CELE_E02H9.2 [Caenorhabditis elegans]
MRVRGYPHNKKYTVLESELHRNNLFQKCSHPNDENVSVVQNYAYLRFPSAEATFDNNGSLIFNTRNFGPIVSSDQNLSPGRYDIVIKATGQLEKGDIPLCADVIDEANFYEEPRSKLSRKGISRYPTIKSHRSNSPSDGAYEYIDVIYPGDQENRLLGYEINQWWKNVTYGEPGSACDPDRHNNDGLCSLGAPTTTTTTTTPKPPPATPKPDQKDPKDDAKSASGGPSNIE